MGILWAMLVGLAAGAVAKLFMPGKDPGGVIITMLLGIAGASVASLLGRTAGWYQYGEAPSFLASILGAMLILVGYRVVVSRRLTQ